MKKLLLICLILLIDCATPKIDPVTATIEDEENLSDKFILPTLKALPPTENAEMQNYIYELGTKIAKDIPNNPYQYSFIVVDSENPISFSYPAGRIFVSASMFQLVENESELVSILLNEIAHSQMKHSLFRMVEIEPPSSISIMGDLVVPLAYQAGCVKLKCKNNTAMKYKSSNSRINLSYLYNTDIEEKEADKMAIELMNNTNYNIQKYTDFYSGICSKKEETLSDYLSIHPCYEDRKKIIEAHTKSFNSKKKFLKDSAEFLKIKKGI